jgi:hypothetical protein
MDERTSVNSIDKKKYKMCISTGLEENKYSHVLFQ